MARPEQSEIVFEIDGREVRAPEGSMLVDAAKLGDVEIPYFCYEPKLGQPVGACRMCLVEIEGMPKLQTACSIVSDPENAVTILPSAACSSRSASSSAASHDIGSRPMRSTRRSGSVILSDAYRCG